MNQTEKLILKVLLVFVGMALLSSMFSSCMVVHRPRKLPNIHRPTRRDIKEAMRHSDWRYSSSFKSIYSRY